MPPLSPLAPAEYPILTPVKGVELTGAHVGIRYKTRKDLLLARLAEGTQMAGVYTKSLTASAPIQWCKTAQASGQGARALIVNSGNSNAFTGKAGEAATARVVDAVAAKFGCAKEQVFMASTGVIGELLPDAKITDALDTVAGQLSADDWEGGAAAILTTDTFKKMVKRETNIGGVPVVIQGIAKGSGMIAPDMATMLAFVFTDASLPQSVLQTLLAEANEQSFNAITVDSDTSTSDCALLFATHAVQHPVIASHGDDALKDFRAALMEVMKELALLIIKDGEGASKMIEVSVRGAESNAAAKIIAMAIANSPLVKTAIAGEDANWGRIVMAIGKAGQRADRDALTIHIGGVLVAANGAVHPDYNEADVVPHMKGQHITIAVDVGIGGSGEYTAYTCDLTHGYIEINGSYRS